VLIGIIDVPNRDGARGPLTPTHGLLFSDGSIAVRDGASDRLGLVDVSLAKGGVGLATRFDPQGSL
jgi:hypothetical protein